MLTDKDKVVSLYKYIRDLSKLKMKTVTNISDYSWSCAIKDIPDDPENIEIYFRDRVDEDALDSNTTLLRVHKPEFENCPEPDPIFSEWLMDGWDSFQNPIILMETLTDSPGSIDKPAPGSKSNSYKVSETEDPSQEEEYVEHFSDNRDRVKLYEIWAEKRTEWAERQKVINQIRKLFTRLYQLHIDLERDSETLEMVVANGFLRDKDNAGIHHPVLIKRVNTSFDAAENTISIEDTDVETELYAILFQSMENINLDSIKNLQDELQEKCFHPLDRNDTPEFLKSLVHRLSPDSTFLNYGETISQPENTRLLLYMNPCFIVRKRIDGALKAVEQIIEDIEDNDYLPSHLGDLVSGGVIDIPDEHHQETIEEQLAAVGGEDTDILLSKEANKEQLEIAQRLEMYNAVLVQGPPGTGKTHTIANLLGHFLAQGKNVLVTSHTKKALTVLKEKVEPGMQNLCVSILDDSNEDMERSIDGITDYMAKYTSYDLKRQMDEIGLERKKVIEDLADTRKKLFSIMNQECSTIVLNGEEISPSKAAAFVFQHKDDLSYIPGEVRLYSPLPATFEELSELYRSNEAISLEDEHELSCILPDPDTLISPQEIEERLHRLDENKDLLSQIERSTMWHIVYDTQNNKVEFDTNSIKFCVSDTNMESLSALNEKVSSLGQVQPWMIHAMVDGKKGGSYKNCWTTLIDQIQKTCRFAESIVSEQFGKEVVISYDGNREELVSSLKKLSSIFSKKGKLSKMDMLFNSSLKTLLNSVTINGKPIQSAEDCSVVLNKLELEDLRKQCGIYWNNLLSKHDVPVFSSLDDIEPERIAQKWIIPIKHCLDWYECEYNELCICLKDAHIPSKAIFHSDSLDSDILATEKIISGIQDVLPSIIRILETALKIKADEDALKAAKIPLQSGECISSKVCRCAVDAIDMGNVSSYRDSFALLSKLHKKYSIQKRRNELINKIAPFAPKWAEAIKNREGIHGSFTVPDTIEDAWKWKQYSGIISSITSVPFDELQARSISLSRKYREVTARYAEKSAWYHLLRETEKDIDMKQALQGWKLTVKKIGKGTGKNAPMYRAKARKLMAKCQSAVPGWIMPVNKALECLDPKVNRFDVVIIDEASQSDITALAIVYMAKKIIIVGDDKQVSPMAIGVEIERMNALEQMYIKDIIPNSHLYNAKTSLYDIAATTFQPLMLREHFRCVPEIIGFSNGLSYDYKIKPLRDMGDSPLLPSVVNYRVQGVKDKQRKENIAEAKNIVALLMSCMEQPEYEDKTFGVISLLGDEQAKRIQSLIFEHVDAADIERRRILCGNASHFQGDERDVVFLSLVDSSNGEGPLPFMGNGVEDAIRKRYNVAASRARDQLWVVHSLDPANDLKPGDIRKRLIDYSINPNAFENIVSEIKKKSESPFEEGVAKSLSARGYHIVQQWPVGSYRLDIVALCGRKKVAIECDGERWHSGEAQIRQDMERQTILERIGWRFIRIRGSEYFSNPDKTIDRVVSELYNYGILPESTDVYEVERRTSPLLERVKARATEILMSFDQEKAMSMEDVVSALLKK